MCNGRKAAGGRRRTVGVGAAGGPAQPARPVAYAPVFYPGTTDAATAATIGVVSGEERVGVDMPLRIVALARLAGTIVDGNGQPVTSATVSLVPKRGDQPSPVDALVASGALALPRATVSASGFAFSGVAPGQYTLDRTHGFRPARRGGGRGGIADAVECSRPHRRRRRSHRPRAATASRPQGDGSIRLRARCRASGRSGDAESVARGDQPDSGRGIDIPCGPAGGRHVSKSRASRRAATSCASMHPPRRPARAGS